MSGSMLSRCHASQACLHKYSYRYVTATDHSQVRFCKHTPPGARVAAEVSHTSIDCGSQVCRRSRWRYRLLTWYSKGKQLYIRGFLTTGRHNSSHSNSSIGIQSHGNAQICLKYMLKTKLRVRNSLCAACSNRCGLMFYSTSHYFSVASV